MPIKYRSDLQRNLTALEADGNIRHLVELAAAISAKLLAAAGVEGANLVLTLADGATLSVDLSAVAGIKHAEGNGKLHASKDGAWTEFVPGIADAEADGLVRARKDNEWVVISADGGGSGGGGSSNLSIPDWDTDAEYLPGDLVRYRDVVWRARVETFANYQPPSQGSQIWELLGFPGAYCDIPLSNRILHLMPTDTYQTSPVGTVLDQILQTQKSMLERIAALE